jgi:hypothetical protein
VRFDHGAKLRFVLHSDESFRRLAVSEQDEGRNPLDTVLCGELLISVDVDLRYGRISLGRNRFDDWFEHLARPTPIGVEVG